MSLFISVPTSQLLLDKQQTKHALNINDRTLDQMVADGGLSPISIHGKVRFLIREIQPLVLSPGDCVPTVLPANAISD